MLREVAAGSTLQGFPDKRRIQDIVQLLQSDDASLGLSVYSTSFSGAPDEIGQWRGYADDGYGASVVVSREAVQKGLGRLERTLCGPVLYDDGDQFDLCVRILTKLYSSEISLEQVQTALECAAVFVKHIGFTSERKYRLVRVDETYQVRESRRRLVPYLDPLEKQEPLAIKSIILGPAWQLGTLTEAEFQRHHVTLGVRRTLDLFGLDSVPVHRSAIPYDPS